MRRRLNLYLLTGFLVTIGAFLSYYLYFVYFPSTRDFPWVNLLLFGAGLALLGVGLRRAYLEPERYPGRITGPLLATVSIVILGFFLFLNFSYSKQLPASKDAPRVGQPAPDFTLPDANGNPVTLSQLWGGAKGEEVARAGQWVLLVFYRGYW